MLRKLAISFALGVVLFAAVTLWFRHELTTPYYDSSATETFVDIPRGATTRAIADLLVEAGILENRFPFILYLRWTGDGKRLQAGEYRFVEPATPVQIVQRLVRGDIFFHSLTIPEGLTARETIELIAHSGLGSLDEMERILRRTEWIRDLAPRAGSLEGCLFPDTYRFPRKADSEEIIRALVDRFHVEMRRLLQEHPLPPGWSPGGIITLASLVEKEVKSHDERLLVASVLTNRLEKGIPLACDPTIIYALKLAGKFDGNIRKSDLGIESPYNTYVHPGLPPGPIASPGADSLRAALAPPKTDYLYFVSRNDGTHQFSKDYQSHQNAVARFQKRGGR